STISGNTAAGRGGGLVTRVGFDYHRILITHSTVSRNSAGTGGGIFIAPREVQLSLGNSILAGNTAPSSADVSAGLSSRGHNLIGDGTGGSGFHETDLVGTPQNPIDPRLAPLDDYGGPTFTHALLA